MAFQKIQVESQHKRHKIKVSVRPTTYCQEAFYLSQIVSFQQFGQGFL